MSKRSAGILTPAPTCTLTRLGREQVRHKSGGHCHVCDGQLSGDDRQLNLALPPSMGGEGSVLNALRSGLQHLPPQPSPRRIAVNIKARRLVGPNPNAATSDKG